MVPLVKRFGLFLDEEGIIRCHGRIDESSFSLSAKQPVLMPTKHYVTELIIRKSHEFVHHNGIKETLNNTRESYWIFRGREAVKRVVRNCVVCKKFEGKPFGTPTTAHLPTSRVSDEPPFANTGVDFAGPLYVDTQVREGVERKMEKAYVCL